MNARKFLLKHRGLFLVGAVFALIYMGNGSYSPYIQLYYKEAGLTTSQIGIITAIGPFASLLFQTAWGRLADRTNRKFVLLLTLVLSAACALLYLLGASYGYILLVAVLYVLFNMSVLPMSDAMALEFCTERRYRFSPIRLCGTIGYALMPILLGTLFSVDLRRIFYAYVIFTCAAALATLFFPRSNEQRLRAASKGPARKKVPLRPLLRDPLVIFLLVANFVISVGICAYTYLPLYASELGYDNNACGLLNAFAALAEIPSLLLIDRVMKRVRGTAIIAASSFFCALRLFLTYISGFFGAGAFAMLTLAQLLQSVSYMTNYYCSANLIHERFPEELKSTAQTLLAMVTAGFSRIFGSIVGGYLSESSVLGLQNTFLFFSLFLLAGSFVVLLAYRRVERPATHASAKL
ncbi:MAG: MFS transporter [Candidatus Spyradocola sp.]|jgi:PPP family 3-phenylpropionic acid transporter